jgi:hypothetical protein
MSGERFVRTESSFPVRVRRRTLSANGNEAGIIEFLQVLRLELETGTVCMVPVSIEVGDCTGER